MLLQRPELFCYAFLFNYFKLIIYFIVTVLNPAPPNWIVSNVITECRKIECNHSNGFVEQTFPCGFGGCQSGYVNY
jgi:hypothetical protein